MTEIRKQAERDALEAAARAVMSERDIRNGTPDWYVWERLWPAQTEEFTRIAQAAITAYLSALSARGMRVMPREATHDMYGAGMTVRTMQDAGERAGMMTRDTGEIWTAMFDAADGGAE